MEELIEQFNTQFPVGSTVRWLVTKNSPFKDYTVKLAAYDHHGMAVAFLNERSGMVLIEPDFVDYN